MKEENGVIDFTEDHKALVLLMQLQLGALRVVKTDELNKLVGKRVRIGYLRPKPQGTASGIAHISATLIEVSEKAVSLSGDHMTTPKSIDIDAIRTICPMKE